MYQQIFCPLEVGDRDFFNCEKKKEIRESEQGVYKEETQ